jgi:hypothetical protein
MLIKCTYQQNFKTIVQGVRYVFDEDGIVKVSKAVGAVLLGVPGMIEVTEEQVADAKEAAVPKATPKPKPAPKAKPAAKKPAAKKGKGLARGTKKVKKKAKKKKKA